MSRPVPITTKLLAAGFSQTAKALNLLKELSLDPKSSSFTSNDNTDAWDLKEPLKTGHTAEELITHLSQVADPDLALLGLVQLYQDQPLTNDSTSMAIPDSGIIKLLGVSQFFARYLGTHLELLNILASKGKTETLGQLEDPFIDFKNQLKLQNIGTEETPCWIGPQQSSAADLRRCYWQRLALIAYLDINNEEPLEAFHEVSKEITKLVDATLEAALALARREFDPKGEVGLAIIAMGKTGAQELNYISDVDVIYAARWLGGSASSENTDNKQTTAIEVSKELAISIARICSGAQDEPALWKIDTALRPEGKDGSLVRTLESHREYYNKWAKSWEFQALLKARPAAGDKELGENFVMFTQELVWKAAKGDEFVEDARKMRARIEETVPNKLRERELKLGPGGLRDIEFAVQLLQLVHGRCDKTLRIAPTLQALEALVNGGYIGRTQGAALGYAYRTERVIEHRTQLFRMQRTHLLPKGQDLYRIGRSIDMERFPDAKSCEVLWDSLRKEVRNLHKEIYYRPLLPATAQLSVEDAALSPDAAKERLAAIGYRDPAGALSHINALTEGVSRRAAIQRQILPVLLGWFSSGVDPDAGLLGFRQISEALEDTHWYMRLLRDSGHAARRLTKILSSSPLVAKILPSAPESIAWLDSEQEMTAVSRSSLEEEIKAMAERHPNLESSSKRLQALRSREIMRCAMCDVSEKIEINRTAFLLTQLGEAVLAGALHLALRQLWEEETGGVPDDDDPRTCPAGKGGLWTGGPNAQHLIVAMGRFGGIESGYTTDADVQFIFIPHSKDLELVNSYSDIDPELHEAGVRESERVARLVSKILSGPGPGAWQVDTALRPEGKNGPVARSLESTIDYYKRHRSAWEVQALLRARPVTGSEKLKQKYLQLIDPLRYEAELLDSDYREIRRLKARMEKERIARGAPANQNVKLGPGGLSDVEWTVQLAQLRFAANNPLLRTTCTKEALQAAWSGQIFDDDQAQMLQSAWTFASQIRAANVLGLGTVRGSKLDQLPSGFSLQVVARLLGYKKGQERDLLDDWLRTARHARCVTEDMFYG